MVKNYNNSPHYMHAIDLTKSICWRVEKKPKIIGYHDARIQTLHAAVFFIINFHLYTRKSPTWKRHFFPPVARIHSFDCCSTTHSWTINQINELAHNLPFWLVPINFRVFRLVLCNTWLMAVSSMSDGSHAFSLERQPNTIFVIYNNCDGSERGAREYVQ